MILRCRNHCIHFPRRPLVMGILNINDDSFSGDGTLDLAAAWDIARRHVENGADIIDVGAESARTNREPISIEDEIDRLRPFVTEFAQRSAHWQPRDAEQLWPPLLSLNSWRPEIAEALLPIAGDMLNDIGALPDSRNAVACAQTGAALLIMHTVGLPKVPHTQTQYADVMTTLHEFFTEKIQQAHEAGVPPEQILLDPGIDFAKQREDNLRIYRELPRLHVFGRPILLPISRKTVIGQVLGQKQPTDRDPGTIACLSAGLTRGAHIFRVHHVAAAFEATKMLWALQCSSHEASGESPFF